METANTWLQLDKFGSTVEKKEITPAEALLLTAEFESAANGKPLKDLAVTGNVVRSNVEELARLRSIYPGEKVTKAFPGASPSFPQTFREIGEEIGVSFPKPATPTPVAAKKD